MRDKRTPKDVCGEAGSKTANNQYQFFLNEKYVEKLLYHLPGQNQYETKLMKENKNITFLISFIYKPRATWPA